MVRWLREGIDTERQKSMHLLTGEPDAGNLHLRFGGRGGAVSVRWMA